VAYAHDVTEFLKTRQDITILHEIIRQYEAASGAQINIQKSTALQMGVWDTNTTIMDIPYRQKATILGTEIRQTIEESRQASWNKTTTIIKKSDRKLTTRLTLPNRIQYIHKYLFARL
jgi:hypothetical protein